MGRFSVDDDSDDDDSDVDGAADNINILDLRNNKEHFTSHPLTEQNQFHGNENFAGRDCDVYFRNGNEYKYDHDHDSYSYQHDNRNLNHRPRNYWRHVLLVIVMGVLQRYTPPPVPPYDSWTEYLSHSKEGFQSTVIHLISLGHYVGSGCFKNMKQDGIAFLNALYYSHSQQENDFDPCSIMVPKSSTSFEAMQAIKDRLTLNIIGQSGALDSISRALVTWDTSTNQDSLLNGEAEHDPKNTRPRPMNMLFAGPDGVGKYETSKEIANLLLNGCKDDVLRKYINCENPSCMLEDKINRILSLQGIDYALEVGTRTRSKKAFIQQILDHIHKQNGAGAIIIIQHVEHLFQDSKLELIRLMKKASVSIVPTMNSEAGPSWNLFGTTRIRREESIDVRLDNCIFLLTTDLGADKIFSGLRSYGLQKRHQLFKEVQQAVNQDAISYFYNDSELFNAVVPFWPLQYKDMKNTMKQELSNISEPKRYSIEIKDAALEYLVGPNYVEYIEMRFAGRDDGSTSTSSTGTVTPSEDRGSMIFATRGGHDLVHKLVIKAIERKLADDSFHSTDEVVLLDYLGLEEISLKMCSREHSTGDLVNCYDRGTVGLDHFVANVP